MKQDIKTDRSEAPGTTATHLASLSDLFSRKLSLEEFTNSAADLLKECTGAERVEIHLSRNHGWNQERSTASATLDRLPPAGSESCTVPLLCEDKLLGAIYLSGIVDAGKVALVESISQLLGSKIDRFNLEYTLIGKNKLYQSLLEHAEFGLTLIDHTYRIVMANAAVAEMHGKQPADLVSRECFRVFGKVSDPCPYCPGTVAMATGKPASAQTTGFHEDGTLFQIKIHALPVFDADNKPSRFVEMVEDISARSRAEEDTRKWISLLSATLEATADGIMARDMNGNIITYNAKFKQMWGLPDEILAAKDEKRARRFVLDILKDPEKFSALTEHAYLQPHLETADTIELKDGRVFERISKPQVVDGTIAGTVISLRDVSERIDLESQLQQSQKMEAIGTLAGGIAHDFNNILTAIVGYASFLQIKMNPADPLRPQVDHILSATARATNLTQSLLAYSRKQVTKPVPVELNSIVSGMEKLLRQILPDRIRLHLALDDDNLQVMADVGGMEQVLMNLVINARDAISAEGSLTISTRTARKNDQACFSGYGRIERYSIIEVKDSGAGMDEATRARIFEPFFTTKEVGKGTGLGLAMVYGIVKQHQGFIDVFSEPGSGTVFTIYLPLVKAGTGR